MTDPSPSSPSPLRRRKSARMRVARNVQGVTESISWFFASSFFSMTQSFHRRRPNRKAGRVYKVKGGRVNYGNKWISVQTFQRVQVLLYYLYILWQIFLSALCGFLFIIISIIPLSSDSHGTVFSPFSRLRLAQGTGGCGATGLCPCPLLTICKIIFAIALWLLRTPPLICGASRSKLRYFVKYSLWHATFHILTRTFLQVGFCFHSCSLVFFRSTLSNLFLISVLFLMLWSLNLLKGCDSELCALAYLYVWKTAAKCFLCIGMDCFNYVWVIRTRAGFSAPFTSSEQNFPVQFKILKFPSVPIISRSKMPCFYKCICLYRENV